MCTKKLLAVLMLVSLLVSSSLPASRARAAQPVAVEPGLQTVPDPRIAYPDLVVTSMVVTPEPAISLQPVTVRVTIRNRGSATARLFSVQWWATWALVGCNWSVGSLASHTSRTLTCTYTYLGWNNSYDIMAEVDARDRVTESNEDNNSLEDTLRVLPAP